MPEAKFEEPMLPSWTALKDFRKSAPPLICSFLFFWKMGCMWSNAVMLCWHYPFLDMNFPKREGKPLLPEICWSAVGMRCSLDLAEPCSLLGMHLAIDCKLLLKAHLQMRYPRRASQCWRSLMSTNAAACLLARPGEKREKLLWEDLCAGSGNW